MTGTFIIRNGYVWKRVSGKVLRLDPTASKTGYQYLSDFKPNVAVGMKGIGHSISPVAMKFLFLCTIISPVYP